jgi:carboxypeptidase family protein
MSSLNSTSKRSWGVGLRKAAQLVCGAMAVLLLCLPLFSQGNAGRILGTVVDQSGGTVAGATVTVIDTDRGVTKTLVTNDAGEYNAPNLTPGNYKVRAEAKGFKIIERTSIVLEVGKEIRVDLSLSPGSVAETMTITEAAPLVETTNATLGGTLNNADIVDMPLNGRNFESLLALRPGVMLQPGGGPWTQSTNGVRPDESAWLIDGVLNSNFYDSRPIAGVPSPITDGATLLPLDSIQEFNLEENPKAEYGWKPGAVVNVGIKSGTNTLHGSAFGFYRSSAWDARNYFNPAPVGNNCAIGVLSQCDKVPTQLKQFGGVVGGPIKKDKLFFFGGYEGLRDLLGNAYVSDGVPETVAQTPTADPANSMVDAITALQNSTTTLCSATIVTNCLSPVSLALAGCTGTPATVGSYTCTGGFFPSNPLQNSTAYLSTFPNVNKSDNYVAKVDYHINSKNTLNGVLLIGRYFGDGEDRAFINKIFLNTYTIRTYTASGSWIWTPSSTVVNEVRVGYNRYSVLTGSDDASVKSPVNTGLLVPGFPVINVGGFHQLGTWHNRPSNNAPNPYYDIQDNVSYLKGKHAFKFGGEYAHIEADSYVPDFGRGQIGFASLTTFFAGVPNAGKALIGDPTRRMLWKSMAAFVQDDYRMNEKLTLNLGLRYEIKTPIREASNLWANFDRTSPTGLVQQGSGGNNTLWKTYPFVFSPRLGFAYDVTGHGTTVVRGGFSVMYSSYSAVMWMNQNQFQNTSGVTLAANPTGADLIFTTGSGTSSAVTTTIPGAAGGIQVKAAAQTPSAGAWNSVVFPPVAAGANIQCGDGLPSATAGVTDPGQCNLMGVDPNLRTPYIINYNLGVQRSFGNNLSLEVGYVGNHGTNLTGYADVNQCPPNTGACVRPYAKQFPYYKWINYMTNSTRSNYNSMQATLTKRMSHGLSFIAGYTFAHGLDNGSLNRFALLPQNANNPGAEYGNSDFDVRHRMTLTTTYNIPGIKGFAQLLEGWQVNGIVTLQSGQPWTIDDYGQNISGAGDKADRWDFFGNPSDFKGTNFTIPYCKGFGGTVSCSQVASQSGAKIVLPNSIAGPCTTDASTAGLQASLATYGCYVVGNSAMIAPAAGTFGTMTRNMFRDSGYKNVDFSVFKNFTYKERFGAQFRLEVFNLINRPIFANPWGASNGTSGGNNDPSAPGGFGGTSGTPDIVAGNPVTGSGSARDVQVGLKITF